MRSSSGPEILAAYRWICSPLQRQSCFLSPEWPQGQGCVAFLPFTRNSLKALISKPYDFLPISVGDHIRKKRLQLGFFQREAAQQLGVDPCTVLNWEKGHTQPPITAIPAILEFLGYDPFPAPETVVEFLKAKRRKKGWTIKIAATAVGVDPGTWGDWERGQTILYRKHRVAVAKMLNLSIVALCEQMATRWRRNHERTSS